MQKDISLDTIHSINELFRQLFNLFPSTYSIIKTQDNLDDAKRSWLKAFIHEGLLTEDETLFFCIIKKAVQKLYSLNQPFMPSCGQFINICFECKKEIANEFNNPKL